MEQCTVVFEMGYGLFYQGITVHILFLTKHVREKCICTDPYFQSHPSPNVLYVQVGNGTEDHRFWGRPEDWNGSNPRPTLKATALKPGY